MDVKELKKRLRQAESIKFTMHALEQMKVRQVTKKMVIDNIEKGIILDHIIEKDLLSKKHTIGFYLSNKRDLYVTLRLKRESIYIITVIVSSKKIVEKIRKRVSRWKKRRK